MSKPHPPEAAWRALGRALVLRRELLGYKGQRVKFAKYRGWRPSIKTLDRLERGELFGYTDDTLGQAEELYDLQPGAIRRFVAAAEAGETAVLDVKPAPALAPAEDDGADSTGDELLDRIMRLPELSIDERRMFVELARKMRERRELEEELLRARRAQDTGDRDRNGSEARAVS